jgi:hypothetical protein
MACTDSNLRRFIRKPAPKSSPGRLAAGGSILRHSLGSAASPPIRDRKYSVVSLTSLHYAALGSVSGLPAHTAGAKYITRLFEIAAARGRHCMTRSHVLLHCPNAKIRTKAWKGKDPGSVKVLLSNSRWEKRLLKFLELSGVGRVMDDGVDEGEARAGRLDGWIPWETQERVVPRAPD